MAKIIYKYNIPMESEFEIELPTHRKILSFQVQNNLPQLWALVDPDTPKERVAFHLFGTGILIQEWIGNYIGTIQLHGYVWHLFED